MSALDPVIAYCGMTHLGLCSAVASAAKGFRTICFDPDQALITALRAGSLPVVEPLLDELFANHADRLILTANPGDLNTADVAFVAVDVPTDENGHSDLTPITAMLAAARPSLRVDADLVILSQVPPGFTQQQIDRFGAGAAISYQVETLIFGRAIQRALEPERYMVGVRDPSTPLSQPYARFLESFGCPILLMQTESAELAKIAINCFLVSSIATTNLLAEICETVGARWDEIAPALRLDRRIGQFAYLTPGLGLGGSNLERDLTTISELSRRFGTDSGIIPAWKRNSSYRRDWALRQVRRLIPELTADLRVAVLGLAYKEDTGSTRNSAGVALARALSGCALSVYDPVVESLPGDGLARAADAMAACAGADLIALMTPWPSFKTLDPAALAKTARGRILLDPYTLLRPDLCAAAGFHQVRLGAPLGNQKP